MNVYFFKWKTFALTSFLELQIDLRPNVGETYRTSRSINLINDSVDGEKRN